MKAKAHNQNRFLRIITIPLRALGKARDFYVRSITNCSARVGYGSMAGIGAGTPLPRSFSATSSRSSDHNDDFMELLRAASGRNLVNKIDVELYLQQQMMQQASVAGSRKMPRSTSVAMGKIDEDKPYVFGEDNVNIKPELKYPRSRSYAPTKRSVVF